MITAGICISWMQVTGNAGLGSEISTVDTAFFCAES